jgi:hypothetical protein
LAHGRVLTSDHGLLHYLVSFDADEEFTSSADDTPVAGRARKSSRRCLAAAVKRK